MNMEILRVIFLALISTLFVHSRYIDDNDEQDLEEFLEDYYDDLVVEYKSLVRQLELERKEAGHVKDMIDLVVKEKTDLEEEALLEAKIDRDYDYMSDAADPLPQDQIKIKDDGNFSGSVLQSNGSIEDPMLMKVHRESGLDPEAILRSRELRLNAIRDAILELRGGSPDVNGTMPSTRGLQELFESHKSMIPNASTNSYTEKVQSFFPSCAIPRPADEEFWNDPLAMNLLFDVKYPIATTEMITDVVSAKLRLYKISQINATTAPEPNLRKQDQPFTNPYSVLATPTSEDDRLLRVSVYWYTLISRRNRSKRKLMDSQMFNTIEGAWMEFNIRNAVRTWKNSGINYGLVVTVEDEDGVLLPTHKYIHAMNCSKEAVTVKPLPSIFIDVMKNQTDNNGTHQVNAFPYPNYLFPILDVTTAEVPVHEADSLMNKMSATIPSGYGAIVARNSSTDRSRSGQDRNSVFNIVGIGSPSAGQNRNSLVPILTKNDVVTMPEDIRMKNELLKAQAERADQPRRRHSRKHN